MSGVDLEVEVGEEAPAEVPECLVGDFDNLAAGVAHEVVVGVVGEVIDGGAVSEVDVINDAETFEFFEEAVHGRLVDVGLAVLDVGGELFGRWMFVVDQ